MQSTDIYIELHALVFSFFFFKIIFSPLVNVSKICTQRVRLKKHIALNNELN